MSCSWSPSPQALSAAQPPAGNPRPGNRTAALGPAGCRREGEARPPRPAADSHVRAAMCSLGRMPRGLQRCPVLPPPLPSSSGRAQRTLLTAPACQGPGPQAAGLRHPHITPRRAFKHPHFTSEDTSAQRGSDTHPRSHRQRQSQISNPALSSAKTPQHTPSHRAPCPASVLPATWLCPRGSGSLVPDGL